MPSKTTVYDCSLIRLRKNHRLVGNLSAVNNGIEVPFDIKRVYYLYDIPGGSKRGGHAHKELQQLVLAASGSFDIVLDDGNIQRTYHLSQPYIGLYLPPGLWREITNFSSGSVCLVLASEIYDESDYIREYMDFKIFKGKGELASE